MEDQIPETQETEPERDDRPPVEPQPERKRGPGAAVWLANLAVIAALAALGFLLWQRFGNGADGGRVGKLVLASASGTGEPGATETVTVDEDAGQSTLAELPPLPTLLPYGAGGLVRIADFDTVIPTRSRSEVITYTVEQGDTLFAIADKYKLKPTTVLWGNFDLLKDNPQMLSVGQELNILPVDGTYYEWQSGDTLQSVAGFFNTDPQAILDYPGKRLDLTASITDTTVLNPDTWVIVPGGSRPIKDWGPPAITRDNPAAARYYGVGYCGQVYSGAVGTGTFVWPTTERFLSGYDYDSIHPAIDIGGAEGNSIFAADSGVVVFSGWSNYGYGLMVVIDHGNNFQTAYAHMSNIGVACGQSVFQGGYLGALGNTGNSTGPHLHFELVYGGAKPNPMDYLR